MHAADPDLVSLQQQCHAIRSRVVAAPGTSNAAIGVQPPQPQSARTVPLQSASIEYALTGNQVATMSSRPHPNQPGAQGYAPESRYAIDPPSAVWSEYQERRERAMLASFPQSTRQANDCHWNFWKGHCAAWGCQTPVRDNYEAMSGRDPLGHRDEMDLAASFIDSRYYTMQPRKYGTIPKVESAFQSYLHVVRVMGCRSIPPLPQKELRRMVKGMNNLIIAELGVEVVLPNRKQPIPNELHLNLLDGIPSGTKLGPFTYVPGNHFARSWRRLLGVLDKSGFRKAEWAAASSGALSSLTYRQIAYCFSGSDLPVRRPTLSMLRAGCTDVWLYLYPVPSKCDPDGSKFCTKAIPFRLTPSDDTVLLFIQEEIRMHEQGLSDAQRDAEPLFSSEPGVAFFRSAIDAALRDALLCFVSADRASTYSFHSWRIRLACKLRAAGCDNPTIQALVRWNTDRAIALYARYEREDYWSILQRAGRHDATSVQFTALPELDESHRILEKLGLTGQPWSAVEQHLQRLLGAPAQREQPPLPPPPPIPSPAAAASATQASSAAPSGLPPGYAMQIRQARSRSYKVYRGPHGMVQSLPAAWRQYNKQAPRPR